MTERPCLRCQTLIPSERLEAIPETRLCVQCSEKVGGDFDISFRRVSVGKTGSLKKNYADVEIVKRRKHIRTIAEEEADKEE